MLLVESVLGLVAVVVATVAFRAFFDGLSWAPYLAGAVVLAGGVTGAGILWRRPAWLTAILTVTALLLLAHYAAYAAETWYGLPTVESVSSLGEGLVAGLPRMLSIGLPADPVGHLLVLPVLLSGAAGAAVVALALRTRRITPLVLPAVLLFLAGMAFTASRGGPGLVWTGVLLLALLTLLLVRSNRLSAADDEGITQADADAVGLDLAERRRRSLRGRLTLGLPAVVAVAALAVVAGWLVPVSEGRDRADPRNLYSQPFTLRSTLSPLVEVRPQVTGERRPLFTVAVGNDTDPPVDRVRVAALDTFDGALWTRSGDFAITGSRLPDTGPLPEQAVEVRLDVEVERLPQPFLPVVGEPVRFHGEDFAFDRATGTVVTTDRDVSGLRYTTTGLIRPRDADLRTAERSETAADVALVDVPDPPSWLRDYANSLTAGAETTFTQLAAIETWLRTKPYNPAAPPGHSYGALFRALADTAQPQIGSAEQYASAFAVMARYKGFPTRVAVGYLLRPEGLQDGVYTVTTVDAHAWPEVHLEGFGWVPFEPTTIDGEVTDVPTRQPDVTLASAQGDQPPGQSLEPSDRSGGSSGEISAVVRTAALTGIVLAVLAALLAGVIAVKWSRRRLRAGRGPPADRVVGAWREVADRLREAGVRVPASHTGREVARELAGSPAAPVARHVEALAAVVAGALFAYEDPNEADAARAWELEGRIRRELGSLLPVSVRLRGLLDPRPLIPRLRRRPGGRRMPAGVRDRTVRIRA